MKHNEQCSKTSTNASAQPSGAVALGKIPTTLRSMGGWGSTKGRGRSVRFGVLRLQRKRCTGGVSSVWLFGPCRVVSRIV